MIKITKSATNDVILTLSEKITLLAPYYLFEFANQHSKEKFYCIASDTSLFPTRYNEFSIIETTSPDPLAGEVEFLLTGFYNYTIYEQTNNSNLDPTLSTGIVEEGICDVTRIDAVYYKHTPSSLTYKVYNPWRN
jgi:hypothetical protein